jgi:hypothetical protein
MTENDLVYMAEYFREKGKALFFYKMAKIHSSNLDTSLYWLLIWQQAIDQQDKALKKVAPSKRIKGMLIAAGFTG